MLVIACSEPCPIEHGVWLQCTWMGFVSWPRGWCTLVQSTRAEFRIKGKVLSLLRCSLGLFGLTWHLTSNCALGCFISLQEVWWFWDCCLHISEVSSRIYLPQTQSFSKIWSAGEERMHRKCLWERQGGKNWREKKRQNSLVLKRKTSVPNSCILSEKPCFLDLLPKDFSLM